MWMGAARQGLPRTVGMSFYGLVWEVVPVLYGACRGISRAAGRRTTKLRLELIWMS